ncbi:MAG: hypothetical protein JEY96_15955 [Bacteroidales bacterium]|nr:hypothetical protein [Bacteroidales bacterium]
MKEKELPKEENQIKKDWEAPKLLCLDKGKTEGGEYPDTNEDTVFDIHS